MSKKQKKDTTTAAATATTACQNCRYHKSRPSRCMCGEKGAVGRAVEGDTAIEVSRFIPRKNQKCLFEA